VTGAAQGIGKATSELVIKLGGAVVALDLNGDVLKASVKSLPAERVMMVTGSVVDADLAARTVEEAVKQFGAVHGLRFSRYARTGRPTGRMDSPSLLSSNRKQLASVSASVHFRQIISLRRHPVSAIWRMVSTSQSQLMEESRIRFGNRCQTRDLCSKSCENV
jgi:NAD(P)-dependent dehydrogenase (short-subunit alcohol dehydrogenase family)